MYTCLNTFLKIELVEVDENDERLWSDSMPLLLVYTIWLTALREESLC